MLSQAKEIDIQLIEWRRHIHRHPELGFEELRTSEMVATVLDELGYRVRRGVGRTGVVADRGSGGPCIAIRADMDALPIQEANEVEYASQVPGVMHACGHDAHTSMGLGAATLLARNSLPGTVRFLFQPSEEMADDEGQSGAPRMVDDGAMDGVDAVLALHVHSSCDAGSIQVASGPVSAGVDTFHAWITGQAAHGAFPHRGRDPIHVASLVIAAVNGIVSRRINPFDPAVITIGRIEGGSADNVIAEEVALSGTIRYLSTSVREQIHTELERALSIARVLGCEYRLELVAGSGPIVNDESVVAAIRSAAVDLIGDDHILPREEGMGAEDFALFAALAPGAMFRLGCRVKGDERKAHSPHFDIDEACLPVGSALLAEAALRLMREAPASPDS